MFGWYFLGAAFAAGSAISSGLFVPMIMMGALVGRMVGLATTEVAKVQLAGASSRRWAAGGARALRGPAPLKGCVRGDGDAASAASAHLAPRPLARAAWVGADASANPWAWIDPGAFALVGAGAFMASVTRLTVALAVIMVEISDDVHLLLPVLTGAGGRRGGGGVWVWRGCSCPHARCAAARDALAGGPLTLPPPHPAPSPPPPPPPPGILVAKWVADAMVHPLYHALLEVKAAPFLAPEPVSKHSLDLLPVRAVMHAPVVSLRTTMRIADIQARGGGAGAAGRGGRRRRAPRPALGSAEAEAPGSGAATDIRRTPPRRRRTCCATPRTTASPSCATRPRARCLWASSRGPT